MSSDGSVSSRIGQFGLYRTIDARTEEFLKLSKKRQIKQGCVCAAVSTAVTVTVVVIIILIYEYKVVTDPRRTIGKSNWIMNKSIDFPALQERFNEANIKIDGLTLKLLPILLKVLHQNRDMEKIMEDPTSLRPPYETMDTTDMTYNKNIFSDTRNWMKIPDSRLYTIEYKTSPIVYFKNPTRNVEYFTKIRKIRDYQRILNYVDKMISDKNSLGSTQPMNRLKLTDSPLRTTTPAAKHNLRKKIKILQTKTPNMLTKEKKTNCKCPHKLNELMKKLLTSIQGLLTYFSGKTSNIAVNKCSETKEIESNTQPSTTTTDTKDVIKLELTQPTIYKTFLNRHKYTVDLGPTSNHDIRREHTINTIMNFIKPNNKQRYSDEKFEPQEVFSGIYNDIGHLESNNIIKEPNTQILPKYTTSTKIPSDAVTTVADYILQKGTYDMSSETKLFSTTFSESDYAGNEEYLDINANQQDNFNKLNIYNREFMKSNNKSEEKNSSKEEKSVTYSFKGVKGRKKTYDNIGVMRKSGNLAYDNKNNSNSLPMLHRFAPVLKTTVTKTTEITNNIKNNTSFIKPTHKTPTFKNETMVTKRNTTTIKHEIPKLKNIDIAIPEHDIEKSLERNISTESALKQIEKAIEIINNETIPMKADKFITMSDDTWELVKSEENTSPMKSILPPSRSTYLEMQRNDYSAKHDETQDYDNDFIDYHQLH